MKTCTHQRLTSLSPTGKPVTQMLAGNEKYLSSSEIKKMMCGSKLEGNYRFDNNYWSTKLAGMSPITLYK